MKTLVLVDGSNLMMRAAFGGELPPEQAVTTATGLLERAARQAQATHLIVALDSPTPSWRKLEFPDYKAHRTRDTSPWLAAAHEAWCRHGWYVADAGGFEADDIIATLAQRAVSRCRVIVVSSDSDLLSLIASGCAVLKPVNGGKFEAIGTAEVVAKYKITTPDLLTVLKALVGESGDNIPGVPGIGPVRAAKLISAYGGLEEIIAAGLQNKCPASITVATHQATARRAFKLVTLRTDVPIPPVNPIHCTWPK